MPKANSPKRLPTRKRTPKWLGYALGFGLTVGFGALLLLPIGDGFARLSYDLPFLFQKQIPEELVIVYIDNQTKTSLGEPTDQPLLRYPSRLVIES